MSKPPDLVQGTLDLLLLKISLPSGRLALGLHRSSVLAQVMQQGLLLAGIGVAIGLAGALGLSRLMTSLLFGVEPTDTATIALVVVTMAGVAAVACGLPAWPASRVDPIVALRDE